MSANLPIISLTDPQMSSSPAPSTPGLDWSDTSQTPESPPTPDHDFDNNTDAPFPPSPSLGRGKSRQPQQPVIVDDAHIDPDELDQLPLDLSDKAWKTPPSFETREYAATNTELPQDQKHLPTHHVPVIAVETVDIEAEEKSASTDKPQISSSSDISDDNKAATCPDSTVLSVIASASTTQVESGEKTLEVESQISITQTGSGLQVDSTVVHSASSKELTAATSTENKAQVISLEREATVEIASKVSPSTPNAIAPDDVPPVTPSPKVEVVTTTSCDIQLSPAQNGEASGPISKDDAALSIADIETSVTTSVSTSTQTELESGVPEAIIAAKTTQATTTITLTESSSSSINKVPLSTSFVLNLGKTLSTILAPETVDRLNDKHSKCIASTPDGNRCKSGNGTNSTKRTKPKLTLQTVTKLLECLSSLERPWNSLDAFVSGIGTFVESTTCKTHTKSSMASVATLCSYSWEESGLEGAQRAAMDTAKCMFEFWFALVTNFSSDDGGVRKSDAQEGMLYRAKEPEIAATATTMVSTSSPAVFKNLSEIPKPKAEQRIPRISVQEDEFTSTITQTALISTTQSAVFDFSFGQTPVAKNPDKFNAPINRHSNLRPYPFPPSEMDLTPSEMIHQTLRQPVTPRDSESSGFIYVFWHVSLFDYVKIGFAGNVAERLQEWRRQCRFPVEEHIQHSSTSSNGSMIPPDRNAHPSRVLVPHPRRVEQLIHAELREYRRDEPECSGCHGRHTEWFNVDAEYALAVVNKWTTRMARDNLYVRGEFRDDLTAQEVEELCRVTPKEELKAGAKRERRETSRVSLGGRKSGEWRRGQR